MLQLQNLTYEHVFPTPFLTHVFAENAELNTELRLRILARSRETRGEKKSNAGGWHSEMGQLEFLGGLRDRLIQQIVDFANEATRRVLAENATPPVPMQWGFAAWANVSRGGDSHMPHTHPGSTWSGVYYVDAGATAADSAALELVDPCLGRANTFLPFLLPSSVGVHPQAGLMVLFPSYLSHAVQVQRGGGTRISIAFNLRKEPFP